jgi:hypothetical protein
MDRGLDAAVARSLYQEQAIVRLEAVPEHQPAQAAPERITVLHARREPMGLVLVLYENETRHLLQVQENGATCAAPFEFFGGQAD